MANTKATPASQDELLAQLEQEGVPGWKPETGDTVMGIVTGIKASMPSEFGIYPIVTVRQDDGTLVALHCFHQVLKTRLMEKRPAAGERIAVRYNGTVEGKAAKDGKRDPYHSYAVVVDRPTDTEEQGDSWDTFAPSDNGAVDTE